MGTAWLDYVDAPLDQSTERYRLAVRDQLGVRVERETAAASGKFLLAELAALGPRPWTAEVMQVGDYSVPEPLSFTID